MKGGFAPPPSARAHLRILGRATACLPTPTAPPMTPPPHGLAQLRVLTPSPAVWSPVLCIHAPVVGGRSCRTLVGGGLRDE